MIRKIDSTTLNRLAETRANMSDLYNEYDNEYTYIYKWAITHDLPIRLVVATKASDNNIRGYTFEKLNDVILSFDPEVPLFEIINKLTSKSKNVIAKDIIFLWFQLRDSIPENERLGQINRWYQLNSEGMIRTKDEYTNINIFNKELNNWKLEMRRQFGADNQEYRRIINIQKELVNYKKVDITNVDILNIRYNVVIDSEFTENDNLYIFDKCMVSIYIPYIAYVDTSNRIYSKIFKPTQDKFIIPAEDMILENSITFNVLTKSEATINEIKYLEDSDFIRVEFDLRKKILSFESDPKISDLILNRISNSLPIFSYSNYREEKVEAKFDLFLSNSEMDQIRQPILMVSFLDLILNNSVFNSYLVVSENTKAQAFKDMLTIQYRSLEFQSSKKSDVLILMKLHSVEYEDRVFNLEDGKTKIVPPEGYYYTIRVNRSPNIIILNDFVNIFRYLIGAYMKLRIEIDMFYKSIYPALEERTRSLIIRNITKKRIKVLEDRDPDVFISGFGTVCQSGHQPLIIEKEDVEAWTSQVFFSEYYGREMHRQAIRFPKNNPKWFFGCDDHKNAFPGVKENTLSNKDKYPYIPYCYETDQINSTETNNYKKYYEQSGRLDLSARNQSTLKKITILKYHNLGSVTKDIESIILSVLENNEDLHVVRLGMPYNTSSILYCICEALEAYDYFKSYNREEYIKLLRKRIITKVNLACCYQENYEMDDKIIIDKFNDEKVFLDPLIYYRLLEEYFEINIFTFWMNTNFESGIEIPRHKIFHASTFRTGRPNILIARHWGGSEDLEYPQCELMVVAKNKNIIHRVLDDNVAKNIYQTFISSHRNITISFEGLKTTGRDNIYNRTNVYELMNKEADAMYIDTNGKMRALYFGKFMIIFPASSPENLKVRKDIISCDINFILKKFGNPIKQDIDINGNIIGLWFQLFDITEGIYIPVIKTQKMNNLEIGSNNPLSVPDNISKLQNYQEIKYLAFKLKEIIVLIFNIYRSRAPMEILRNDNLVIEFVNGYFGRYEQELDAFDFYKLDRLPSYLPKFRDVNESLIYFSKYINFVQDRKIIFTSEKLMDNAVKFLRRYFNNTRGLTPEANRTINLYFNERDFDLDEETLLFLSNADMRRWIDSLKFGKHLSTITTRLKIERAVVTEPYLYKSQNEQIYLIQNVHQGIIERALYACYKWLTKKRNPGFLKDSTKKAKIKLNYLINAITIDGFTVVMSKSINSEIDNLVELLVYNDPKTENGYYAAMLPLLNYENL